MTVQRNIQFLRHDSDVAFFKELNLIILSCFTSSDWSEIAA